MSDLKMPQQFPPPFPDLSPSVQTFFSFFPIRIFFLDCFSSSSLTAVEDQASVKKEEARLQHVPDRLSFITSLLLPLFHPSANRSQLPVC